MSVACFEETQNIQSPDRLTFAMTFSESVQIWTGGRYSDSPVHLLHDRGQQRGRQRHSRARDVT